MKRIKSAVMAMLYYSTGKNPSDSQQQIADLIFQQLCHRIRDQVTDHIYSQIWYDSQGALTI